VSTGDRATIAFVLGRLAPGEAAPLATLARGRGAELLEWLHATAGPLPPGDLAAIFAGELHELPSDMALAELRWRLDHGAGVASAHPQLFGLVATADVGASASADERDEREAVLRLLYEAGCPMTGARRAVVLSPWSNGGQLVQVRSRGEGGGGWTQRGVAWRDGAWRGVAGRAGGAARPGRRLVVIGGRPRTPRDLPTHETGLLAARSLSLTLSRRDDTQ